MKQRRSLFPPKPSLKAYFHSKILISNSDFNGGGKDLVMHLRNGRTEEEALVTWRPCVGSCSWEPDPLALL
ncbi:hypothetical protein ES319_A06G100800v1 [Gossypium barbadense]|uniref:Uncharacterized protein n=1 Tax=Gossypium barbadense TaxID=3634 RepID=A0A5J5VCB7_GOSBA|nr:hypothetical protein ES319_A06G100800v1 [Gossypium barbadense]